MTQSITWEYLSGLFTSDGSLVLGFRGSSITATFKISSKSNDNTLDLVQQFCISKGFAACFSAEESENSGGRAPVIRIQGPNQVLKFLEMFKQESNVSNIRTPIIGPKARELEVAIFILKNREEWSPILRKDWVTAFRETSSPNQTVNDQLKKICLAYDSTMQSIEKAVVDKTLEVNSDYIVGLTDGDGGFHVTFSDRKREQAIEVQVGANHTTSADAWLTSYVWSYALGVTRKPTFNREKKACSNKMNNLAEHQKVIEYFTKHQLLGNYRSEQFQIYVYTFEFKRSGVTRRQLNVYREKLLLLIRKVYSFEASKGRNRLRTLESLEELVKEYYSDK